MSKTRSSSSVYCMFISWTRQLTCVDGIRFLILKCGALISTHLDFSISRQNYLIGQLDLGVSSSFDIQSCESSDISAEKHLINSPAAHLAAEGIHLVSMSLAESLFHMVGNFISRYINGNKRGRGMKISHWNKGNSLLSNKMSEIKLIVKEHKLGLSWAKLRAS